MSSFELRSAGALAALALAWAAPAATAQELAVPLRPDPALILPPFTEDGYYSLQVAARSPPGTGRAWKDRG